jgi:N-acyl-D-aspartate/D-glutamate deacylase
MKMAANFDLVIKGGLVVDGTGNPWLKKDVGISGGKIQGLGRLTGVAGRTIDASGLIISPGFVDLHNHSDRSMLPYPDGENYIMQGVTTLVVGNCGLSFAPLNPDRIDLLKRYFATALKPGFDYGWEWRSFAEYYDKVARQGTSLNLAPLVGQGTIRLAVKGFDSGPATKEEMDEMKILLARSLEEGAFGVSTGLIYPPGSYSSTEELVELTGVVNKYGAIYTTHLRSEGSRLMESLEEAIRIGEQNDIPVEISHHKAMGKSNWGKVNATLRTMEQARQRGVDVSCDVYPYVAGSTRITSLLPLWALAGGMERMIERLKDGESRKRMQQEISENIGMGSNGIRDAGWPGILIAGCDQAKEYEGKSLEEILKGKSRFDGPFEAFFDWLLEIGGNASMVLFGMDEADVRTVMSSPLSAFGSDSSTMAPSAGGKPHPRAYGTFPRVLGKYVRE